MDPSVGCCDASGWRLSSQTSDGLLYLVAVTTPPGSQFSLQRRREWTRDGFAIFAS
jgi:hypothetical protein